MRWLAVPTLSALIAAMALSVACGDGEAENQNQNHSQNQNPNNGDPEQYDDNCQRDANGASDFEVPAPEGYEQTRHARMIRVGDELWVSFVAIAEVGELERAYLTRLGCDGAPVDEPMRLGRDDVEMEAGGAMATDDEVVYVVWREDLPEARIETRGRTFDKDGSARQDEPFAVEVMVDGEDESWPIDYPELVVNHEGDAVVVGEALVEQQFFAMMQRIDDDGDTVGDGFFLDDSGEAHQVEPAVAMLEDNDLVFAYLETTTPGPGAVYHGTVSHDGHSVDEGPTAADPAIGEGNLTESVRLATNPAGGPTWMTYPRGSEGENTVVIREAANLGPALSDETTRISGQTSFFADVAAGEEGGAIAWLSGSPLAGNIHFQRFLGTGVEITDVKEVIDHHQDEDGLVVAPFGPDIVWLFDEVYAAVWVEREEENEIRGTVIDFSEFEDDGE